MTDQPPLEHRVVETSAAQELVERSAAAKAADHAAISGSIDELLPALIARLGATGLAELEVREDALRVRLRRPPEGAMPHDRRAGDRAGRTDRSRSAGTSSAGGHGSGLTPVGPGREVRDGRESRAGGDGHEGPRSSHGQAVATSPAVGIYHPRAEARAGTKVRAGDRLGSVDMLGVPQEVVAPTDGLIGASLVDPGDAVEYGQELVVIEFPTSASDGAATAGTTAKRAAPSAPATPAPASPPTVMDH